MEANELLLLGILDQEEMHGYKLHEFLDHQLRFVSEMKRPTAYRLLESMLRRGLVEGQTERAGRRPERMVYRITPAGRERFKRLLREQLGSAEQVIHSGNVALLFLDRLPIEERLALLEQRRAGADQQRVALRSVVDAHSVGSAARLALEHDLAHLELEVSWLTQAVNSLRGECLR